MMKTRNQVIPAAHLFLLKDGQILLSRRFQTGYEDGKYSVPAGHVELGETATQAITREAKEEIGIICSPTHLNCIHVMHRKNKNETIERIDFFFLCDRWEGDVQNLEPEKCDDLRWFAMEDLPVNTVPYVRFAISNYQHAIFFSEHGWGGEL